jgi:hypothetical protein
MQQAGFQQIDQASDREPEQRENDDPRQQLIGLHQIAGLQHEGADAEFGAGHLGQPRRRANCLLFIEGEKGPRIGTLLFDTGWLPGSSGTGTDLEVPGG